ncbi:hypothetical protein GCM10017559_20100 [Streptosporangium longisporum]|uniref:Uncharacterized protein n=1 Tax=Streptosporangium longisporum TaxID=46187 RepID=A0ABN3XV73_9ACTN
MPTESRLTESPTVVIVAKLQIATSEVSGMTSNTEILNRMDVLDAMSPQRLALGSPGWPPVGL